MVWGVGGGGGGEGLHLPLKMPCVTIAMTSRAPCSLTVAAAFLQRDLWSAPLCPLIMFTLVWCFHSAYARVPQVSAMSSTNMATLSTTSPTSTIRPTTFGRGRSLWMRAKPRSRRSAIDVALGDVLARPGSQCPMGAFLPPSTAG